MKEIPEDDVKQILSNKESLAPCDVAVFVYDRYLIYLWCNIAMFSLLYVYLFKPSLINSHLKFFFKELDF